jgi:integrase
MGSVYRQKDRKTWMIRYSHDGRRRVESSGSTVYDEAVKLLHKREGAIADGRPVSTHAGRLRFETAAADVVNDYLVNGKKSIADVRRRIKLHLTPFFGGRKMITITTTTVRAYVAHRQATVEHDDGTETPGASNAQINRELSILNRAFTLALDAETLTAKPRIKKLAERNVRTGFFEREQYEAVIRELPAVWRPVMTFAFLTGWRVRSEVLPITWAQVDARAETVRLEVGTTKNSEGRTFPYGVLPELAAVLAAQAGVRDALKKQGTISPWVFPDVAGGRLPAFYSVLWREACKAAECPGKIPHDFRRTAIRNLVRAGVPEKTAMLLTGHKTRSVFDRYDIINEADLREAVSRFAAAPVKATAARGRVARMPKRAKR